MPAVRVAPDTFLLTRKLREGLNRYAELWPGPVTAVLPPADAPPRNLDPIEVRREELNFELKVLPYDSPELRSLVRRAGLVHWGPHHQLHDLGDVLSEAGVPSVYVTEYSLRTRQGIITAARPGLLRRSWRRWWEWREERKIRHNIARVSGFEANGTPTFDAYRRLNPHHHLFFDTRTTADMIVGPEDLEARLARAADPGRPLHLVFSGRLAEMKGALDLVDVAAALKRRGVPFRMSICGGGPLEEAMRARAGREGLELAFRGVMPFATALAPFIRREADVFVCCHPQGDPSCTYLETFACGVPIAGYRNEALEGLLKRVDAGWGTPVNDPKALAGLLARLHQDRSSLPAKSRAARAFAAERTFERTFAARVDFFVACAARKP
ncbi:MAG TPA: glycosyltransferase family 4 protein [Planctomycetota bacterium]